MANMPKGVSQYLARFGAQSVACNPYALTKLGVDKSRCFLKLDDYVVLCVPFQLGFKRSVFIASLSKQELLFFQKYVNGLVGLSLALNPDKKPEPVKFFIHCTLNAVGQMKGRENVGLFVLDFKTCPEQMVMMMGTFLENQERIRTQYEDYGKTAIRMTADTAKIIGYNMYATVLGPEPNPRRIQVFNISSKTVEHLEAAGAPLRANGSAVAYQLFFQKYRVSLGGIVEEAGLLPQGLVRTKSSLAFSSELVEIIDDYWYSSRK